MDSNKCTLIQGRYGVGRRFADKKTLEIQKLSGEFGEWGRSREFDAMMRARARRIWLGGEERERQRREKAKKGKGKEEKEEERGRSRRRKSQEESEESEDERPRKKKKGRKMEKEGEK